MNVDNKTASLMAVAASVAANCQRCLEVNASRALGYGAGTEEIADAVRVGSKVRAGAAAKMDAYVASLDVAAQAAGADRQKCGCA